VIAGPVVLMVWPLPLHQWALLSKLASNGSHIHHPDDNACITMFLGMRSMSNSISNGININQLDKDNHDDEACITAF